MRSAQTLFLVSAALFIAGIAFLIAGARSPRASATGAPAPAAPPLASIRQIMDAIVLPNATTIYDAVGSSVTKEGIVETAPKNDEEWAAVAASAAVLAESGELLMLDGRRIDSGEWMKMSQAFVSASNAALKAANEKSVDGIFATGGDLNETCDRCHARYQR